MRRRQWVRCESCGRSFVDLERHHEYGPASCRTIWSLDLNQTAAAVGSSARWTRELWTTKDGRTLRIRDMATGHLVNTLLFLDARGETNRFGESVQGMIDELGRRNEYREVVKIMRVLDTRTKVKRAPSDNPKTSYPRGSDPWTERRAVRSRSNPEMIYVVAYHRDGYWGCTCLGWRNRRTCRHVEALEVNEANLYERKIDAVVDDDVIPTVANLSLTEQELKVCIELNIEPADFIKNQIGRIGRNVQKPTTLELKPAIGPPTTASVVGGRRRIRVRPKP